MARVEDSGKGGAADGIIESLLDLYQYKLHVLRVLSPGAGFLTIRRMAIHKPYGLAIWFAPYIVIWFRMAIRP